ncbi:MG2 domain-containing protein [Mucilaginibacter sp. X4EP1]|uniref:alpha-2-macroglobulin family protein n=1 Tax=Mucilaginibacter sp. X4EP1 TaxID=2723092 RepID=UPI002169963E|nr:MG2 domain-containing protein [Mucilaginibacter sp. X4EP1]MCS3811928.1 TonB-dependent SusC/RagA subfamily outer membrane receptor [Mucilaginibacter sp. X4EP1]
MKVLSLNFFKYLLALALVFSFTNSFCQLVTDTLDTKSIVSLEKAIEEKRQLSQTQQGLGLIKQQAIQLHNDILLARSLYDLMLIRDLRTEDTSYFRNSAFIDTLLRGDISPKLKAILLIMRARRVGEFDYRFQRPNYTAYRTKNLKPDYAALDPAQRERLATIDLNAALNYRDPEFDGNQLLWLSSNPSVFLFNPKFEDIVLSERVNLLATNHYYYYFDVRKTPLLNKLLQLSPTDFRSKLDSIATIKADTADALVAYRQWLSFNKKDLAVSSFIESLIRKNIFLYVSSDSVAMVSYINYLQANINSPYPATKAHTVYQLCLIWNEEGNKYANFNPYYQSPSAFNPQYQFFPVKALKLYVQNQDLINKYPLFNRVLDLMARQIRAEGIRIEMDNKHLPDRPIPVKVIYKNTDSLFYRIIRIGSAEPQKKGKVKAIAELLNRPLAEEGNFALPLPADNNRHAVYLKLGQLPLGHYRLLFSNLPIKADGDDLYNIAFEVTNITAINRDERVFVLNRKTGFPLTGAQIKAFKEEKPVTGFTATVNTKGFIDIKANVADSINITYKGDTTGYKFFIRTNNFADNVYNKEEDDNLIDFYDNRLRTEIFTDRSIYRPGQTVHFKIIFLTDDPNTGDRILFNEQNIGRDSLKKWLKDANDQITLNDPFGKTIDTIHLKINDFGSFAGSFVIPKTAATGDWSIVGSPRTNYENSGNFKVEEYKRPTIALTMEKPKKMLKPGESFVIKLKLRSLNGSDLGNIPVNYTIKRGGYMPSAKTGLKNHQGYYSNEQLIHQSGYTDDKGELSVSISDSVVAKAKLNDTEVWNYNYSINAIAVDATGESTEINENIYVSSRPVKINIPLNNTYDKQVLPVLNVGTTADFEGTVGKKVNIKLYKVTNPALTQRTFKSVDQWYYSKADWNTWFPNKAENVAIKEEKTLVLDTIINTAAYKSLALAKALIKEGYYQLAAEVKEDGKIIGQSVYSFDVFDSKANTVSDRDINYMSVNTAKPGDLISWYNSSKKNSYTIYQVLYVGRDKKKVIRNIYQTLTEKAGISLWQYRIPADATEQVLFNRLVVNNNEIEKHEKRIYVIADNIQQPEIIVEKYRKVMAPGTKETFTLSVKTKNDNIAAEIMTTLYDAALDKLENHRWGLPNTNVRPYYFNNNDWNYTLTGTERAGSYEEGESSFTMREISTSPGAKFNLLEGRVAGLSVADASGLQEVVVVGYQSQKRIDITGAISNVSIRGVSSLKEYSQPMMVIDGQVYSGDLNSINLSAITQIMVLKGADASALYGAQAAQGVLVISTKGPIVLPAVAEAVVKIRKNFNETAFFFPQLRADADGFYTFSFAMPETATEWSWKILAHTQKAQFTYLEKTLQTQLNLMIQPNMPRLLYQGDQITLQSRVTNLDTLAIQGKATCKIEDAVTGEDITNTLIENNSQVFKLDKKSSGAVSFLLKVPAGQSNPLKIVIVASSGNMADAEEHIIPVLSTKVFTRQSQPLNFTNQPTLTVSPVKLPADASLYGVGVSIAQKPQSALIYALPWLADYSFDCAEQTFNKLRARVTALRLMQKDTSAQKTFKKAATAVGQYKPKDDQLPDELADETMPWLGISNNAAHQQEQLFHLLDTSVTKPAINKHLDRLYKLQQADGGLSWFDGGKSNAYISAYVLAGFGQLKQMGWSAGPNHAHQQKEFINNLLKYEDDLLLTPSDNAYNNLFQLYALSYWVNDGPLSPQLSQKTTSILIDEWKKASNNNLEQQTLLIITTLRFTNSSDVLNTKAQQQLENIRQMAIQDDGNGLRWKDISNSETLNSSEEETMALLAEAFDLSGKYKEVPAGIVKWLLNAKQGEHWQTTKGTAAAINLLQKEKGSAIGDTKAFSTQINGHSLSVSDGLLDGVPAASTILKEQPQSVTIQQQGTNIKGDLTWYYFAEPSKLDTLNKAIKVSKQFFSYDNVKGWLPLNANTQLKTGDRVKVKLTVETALALKFVHINDPRAAAFEPKENNGGYRYNDNGFSYYQSIRDAGLDIFAEAIPRGISEISYELVVAHDGEFTSGPARLLCMYQPALTAYSGAVRVKVN